MTTAINIKDATTADEVKIQNKTKCIGHDRFIEVDSLARAYVPNQIICSLYDGEKSFISGTVFPELDKPYMKRGGK